MKNVNVDDVNKIITERYNFKLHIVPIRALFEYWEKRENLGGGPMKNFLLCMNIGQEGCHEVNWHAIAVNGPKKQFSDNDLETSDVIMTRKETSNKESLEKTLK